METNSPGGKGRTDNANYNAREAKSEPNETWTKSQPSTGDASANQAVFTRREIASTSASDVDLTKSTSNGITNKENDTSPTQTSQNILPSKDKDTQRASQNKLTRENELEQTSKNTPSQENDSQSKKASEENDSTQIPRSTFTLFDAFLAVVFAIFWLLDVLSDLQVAISHFVKEEWFYGTLILALLVICNLIVAFIGVYAYIDNRDVSKCWWVCRIVFLIFGLSPLIMTAEYLHYGWMIRSREDKMALYEKTAFNRAVQRFIQSFLSSGPTFCAHLYIIFDDEPDDSVLQAIARAAAVISSWSSLALSAMTCFKLLHGIRKLNTDQMKVVTQIVIFLWRFFETGCRIVCVALFTSRFGGWVFVILFLHLVSMATWLIAIDKKRNCSHVIFDLICAYIMVYYDPFTSKPSRYAYLLYYVIFYTENFVMLALWAGMTSDDDDWFYIPSIAIACGSFLLHVVLQILYYRVFHPSGQKKGKCMSFAFSDLVQSVNSIKTHRRKLNTVFFQKTL